MSRTINLNNQRKLMGICLSYSHISNQAVSLDKIINKIKKYDRNQLLAFLSKLDIAINSFVLLSYFLP